MVTYNCSTISPEIPRPWLDRTWLILCLLFATIWCVTASTRLSATFDEPNYVSNGLESWRTGSYKLLMRQGTMPLPIDIISLPLYLWEKWRDEPFRIGSDTRSNPVLLDDLSLLLPWARLGTLVFAWLLIVYGWLLGRRLAGAWGGRLAAVLLATEPSVLAHSALATTDVAVTACMVALVYHFDRGREQSWTQRVGVPGLWYGLAMLSKASAMVFAPLCLLGMELVRLMDKPAQGIEPPMPFHSNWQRQASDLWLAMRPFRRDLVHIILLAMVVTFVYVGSDFQPQGSFVKWAESLGDNGWARTVQWLAHHLRIFTNAGEALVKQVRHNVRGHGVFLLGHVYPRAVWIYFPVLLSIKLTLSLLLAPLLVLAFRPRGLGNWVLVCALVLLAFSITFRVQIGIRLILPLVALLAIGFAVALTETVESQAGWKRRLTITATVLATAWSVFSAVRVWPHGLCYTNEFWGGTEKGYLRMSDSNYDWGQGLKDLDQWRRDHGLAAMDLWHFAPDPARERPPFHHVPLSLKEIAGPQDIGPLLETGYLAVGTTWLYGGYDYPALTRAASILRTLQPVGRTMTHFIYAFPKSGKP